MLLGLLAGLGLGLAASVTGSEPLVLAAEASGPLGTLFIRALQMVVIPLVMTIVFAGVARLGDTRSLGRLGGVSLGFIWLTTLPAVVLGMGSMHVALQLAPNVTPPPGAGAEGVELPGLLDFVLGLIPANPFQAMAEGRLLPLLVFALLFGAATGTLATPRRERLVEIADAVTDAFIKLVEWILWTAPIGIFGLAAPATARMGLGLLQSLAVFIVTVVVALFVFMGLFYLPAVVLLGGVRPGRFIRGTLASYTMGFTTTSSVATLPVLLRDAPALGVSRRVTDLVVPLAASLNRAGSGLFQGASVVFVAWLYDVQVPGGAWVGAILACFLAASTVAPVPSASIMTLAPALNAVGAPVAGLGILLGVDRIPDMFRSGTNMTGHMAAAVVTEGMVGGPTSEAPTGADP
jgi:Na+/H+-dicarboxylate symporter